MTKTAILDLRSASRRILDEVQPHWVGAAVAAAAALASMAQNQANTETDAAGAAGKAGVAKPSAPTYAPTASKPLAGTQDADVARLEQRPPAGDLGALPQGRRLADVMNGGQPSSPTASLGDAVAAGAQLKAMNGGADFHAPGAAPGSAPTSGVSTDTGVGATPGSEGYAATPGSASPTPSGAGSSDTLGYAQAGAGLLGQIIGASNPGTPQAQIPGPGGAAGYTPTANAAMQANQQGVGNMSLQDLIRRSQGGSQGAYGASI